MSPDVCVPEQSLELSVIKDNVVIASPAGRIDPVDAFRRRMGDRLQLLGPDWQKHLSVRCFDMDEEWAK